MWVGVAHVAAEGDITVWYARGGAMPDPNVSSAGLVPLGDGELCTALVATGVSQLFLSSYSTNHTHLSFMQPLSFLCGTSKGQVIPITVELRRGMDVDEESNEAGGRIVVGNPLQRRASGVWSLVPSMLWSNSKADNRVRAMAVTGRARSQ